MTIERATLQHLDKLIELFEAYREFYGKEADPAVARTFLKERMVQNESVVFIARDNDGIATGFTQLYPLFSSTRMKPIWLLNDLFVAPEFRGRKISKKLIDRAKVHCRQTHACGLSLETAKTNTVGNALYPNVGFKLDKDHNFYFWEAS